MLQSEANPAQNSYKQLFIALLFVGALIGVFSISGCGLTDPCGDGKTECNDGCMPEDATCHPSGDGYCNAGDVPCHDGCMPEGGSCCPLWGHCNPGQTCGSDNLCRGGGGGGNTCGSGNSTCINNLCSPGLWCCNGLNSCNQSSCGCR